MAIVQDGKGYKIPLQINPEEAVCIRVYIPADQLYIAAFFGALWHFAKWVAWERDDTHRGKEAADVWKYWIQKTVDDWDCSHGDCGLMDVRQLSETPCILEKLDSCSGEWQQFADTRLCVPMMRLNGMGEIEQWNGTDWVSAAPDESTGEEYNPGHDIANQIAHYDPPPSGEDGACLAAINAVKYLQAAIDFEMAELKELPYLVRLIDSFVTTWLWRVAGFLNATFLNDDLNFRQAWDLLEDSSLTHEDDIIAYDIVPDALCKYIFAYNDDGTMSEAAHETLMSELQSEVNDREDDEKLKWEWLMLLSYPGPSWLANISDKANIDTYNCDVCGWHHVFDFSSSDDGWEINWTTADWYGISQTGGFLSGGGWQGGVFLKYGQWRKSFYIRIQFPTPSNVKKIIIHYNYTKGYTYDQNGGTCAIVAAFDEDEITRFSNHFSTQDEGNNLSDELNLNSTIDEVCWFLSCSKATNQTQGNTGSILGFSVEMFGAGTDPF